MKVINQMMVKDACRDENYTGTMRCACCGEESNLPSSFPFPLDDMVKHLKAFVRMHDIKGCNEKPIDSPEWASGEIEIDVI